MLRRLVAGAVLCVVLEQHITNFENALRTICGLYHPAKQNTKLRCLGIVLLPYNENSGLGLPGTLDTDNKLSVGAGVVVILQPRSQLREDCLQRCAGNC